MGRKNNVSLGQTAFSIKICLLLIKWLYIKKTDNYIIQCRPHLPPCGQKADNTHWQSLIGHDGCRSTLVNLKSPGFKGVMAWYERTVSARSHRQRALLVRKLDAAFAQQRIETAHIVLIFSSVCWGTDGFSVPDFSLGSLPAGPVWFRKGESGPRRRNLNAGIFFFFLIRPQGESLLKELIQHQEVLSRTLNTSWLLY